MTARLEELYAIGRGDGANRPGLSVREQEAYDLAARWMESAGLDVSSDPAGNLVGQLPGLRPELPAVWTGSHLDTVPDGGRFDGALGVIAGLEAIDRIGRAGRLERTVAVVAFRCEEGWRFGRGVFGSRALCGRLEDDEYELRDRAGTTLGEALDELGIGRPPRAGWLERGPGCFVEAHIEQGPRLDRAGAPLGVVTGIAGMAGLELELVGRAGHAGTTPMAARADALAAAAEVVLRIRQAASGVEGAVATVGRLHVAPGATNVIPARASLFVDVRAPAADSVGALVAAVERAAEEASAAAGCEALIAPRWRYLPVSMAVGPTAAVRRAVARLGVPVVELPSGAGHDAAILAEAGVPCAMLFVRSLAGGVSHVPQEHTDQHAIDLCVSALEAVLTELAG